MSKVRFQLDEHVSNAVARALRQRDIDVLTAHEADLRTVPDADVLASALAAGRVVVTQDAHFPEFHHQGRSHAGIAYCEQGTRSIGQIVEALLLIHEVMQAEEMVNWLEYL